MKKLLIVTDSCFSRKEGIVRFLSEIIPYIKNDFDIKVIAGKEKEIRINLGVPIYYCKTSKNISDFPMAWPDFKLIKNKVCASDIVWIQSYGPLGLTAHHYAIVYRKPICFYSHLIEWQVAEAVAHTLVMGKIWASFVRMAASYYYNNMSLVMVPSKNALNEINRIKSKTHKELVALGINFKKFKKSLKTFKEKKDINIAYVGRLAPEKDLITLKRAFEKLEKNNKNINLIFIGDGSQDIKGQLKGRKIKITGFVDNVENHLKKTDIFVLPSLTETTSLATIEAMACGIPVITTRVGDLENYVKDRVNGYFFEKGNAKELASKIEILIKNKKLRKRFGENARKSALKAPSWKETAERIKDLINKL